MKYKIAPSILSADFSQLKSEINKIETCQVEMLHIDVMDGHFVPNITIGPIVVKHIRPHTKLLLDTHLMIVHPQKYIKPFVEAGSDIITIHFESDHDDLDETIKMIKGYNKKVGLSLNPDTPLEKIEKFIEKVDMLLLMTVFPGFGGQKFISDVLPKIKEARKFIDSLGKTDKIDLQVDGGITDETIELALKAGANVFVAGSYVFGQKDYSVPVNEMRKKINIFNK